MEDNLSTKSTDSSITTSGEYEIVMDSNIETTPSDQAQQQTQLPQLPLEKPKIVCSTEPGQNSGIMIVSGGGDGSGETEIVGKAGGDGHNSPTLEIVNNRNISELQHEMTDALRELKLDKEGQGEMVQNVNKSLTLPLASTSNPQTTSSLSAMKTQSLNRRAEYAPTPRSEDASMSELNRVGQSVFYDCIDASPAGFEEKQDAMKPEKNDTDDEVSEIDQGCTIFAGVTYLGAANINAPRSEIDVYRIMSELNTGSSSVGLKISISIPNCSEGLVVLHDAESNSVIATYEIQSIILFFRGPIETVENGCFAFTWLHGESLFQCHVFRCNIPEAVNQVSACFQKAFQTYPPPSMTCSLTSAIDSNMVNSVTSDISGNPLNTAGYEFLVSLEIREKVAKNSTYAAVPRDRSCFKLRANTDKEILITVKQTPSAILQPLLIERCFGVLLSPGKLVRQADMQLIELVSMGYQQSAIPAGQPNVESAAPVSNNTPISLTPYFIRAEWKANELSFEQLNAESSKTFLTVAVNIVVRGIQEPVCFVIETPVAIQSPSEIRIIDHFISKRPMMLRFYLHLTRTVDELSWKVSSIDPSEEILEQAQPSTSASYLLKFGMNNLSRIVRSSSIASIEDECATTDYSSDGDEPLLSGTGEVSKDCSQDTLDEWDPVLKEWDGDKRPKNLATLVRLGVPEALREMVWQRLANPERKTELNDIYKTLITKETKCETVILRDIHRTFPAHKCFKENGGSGQDALFKVSKAYAVHDSEVGYCQGLSFIAASLLLHMPEEDAFCVLVSLMYDYGLRDLYKQGFEVLYLRLYQLERLIKDQLPKLYEHFDACGIETHMYASQWFLTLFTARFPLCFVFHVLDVFLLDGLHVLFQVALTLLFVCESELRQLDFEGILKYFRVTLPKKCRSSSQARRIMKMACERKIKKLRHYEEEFLIKKQHKERLEKEAQVYENRFGEERQKLQSQIEQLQKKLVTTNVCAVEKEKKHTGIIQDYKSIIQRLEQETTTSKEKLQTAMAIVSQCQTCSSQIGEQIEAQATNRDGKSFQNNATHNTDYSNDAPLGPLDPLNSALQRVRELELELAQAKLAQVEAECRSQDLNHQLSATLNEMQTNRNSWQPWLSKTFNSLQEKVSTRSGRDAPVATFQSYMGHQPNSSSAGGSEASSPNNTQDFKAFAAFAGGSPKFPAKFQAARLRNSIDSLRNIVGPTLDNSGKGILGDHFKQQVHSQF